MLTLVALIPPENESIISCLSLTLKVFVRDNSAMGPVDDPRRLSCGSRAACADGGGGGSRSVPVS